MNHCNNLFRTIKDYYKHEETEPDENHFETIIERSAIPREMTSFYLGVLYDLELIKYSLEEKYIHLTSIGRRRNRLFEV